MGLQVYIHRDGTGSLTPGDSNYLQALLRPREHYLDGFNGVSLTEALAAALEGQPDTPFACPKSGAL